MRKDIQQKVPWNRCHETPNGNRKLFLTAQHAIFQLLLDAAEKKEVAWCKIRTVGWMFHLCEARDNHFLFDIF
jgi:hypothetical protein